MTSWIVYSPPSDRAFYLFSSRSCRSCCYSCCSRRHLWQERVAALRWRLWSLFDVRFLFWNRSWKAHFHLQLFWVCSCDCRCWLKDNDKAWLAHYFTTMTILVALVFSGLVMLYFVFRQIRSREEWRQNRVAFLSMWGLSCLFGTTWVLAFLSFGPFSQFFVFLFCILNSFQGLHMLNAISPYSSFLSHCYQAYTRWTVSD